MVQKMEIEYSKIRDSFPNKCLSTKMLNTITEDTMREILRTGTFHIPDIFELIEKYPELEEKYINAYTDKMRTEKLTGKKKEFTDAEKQKMMNTNKEEMVVQGMLFDCLVSAYNIDGLSSKEKAKSENLAILSKEKRDSAGDMELLTFALPTGQGIVPSERANAKESVLDNLSAIRKKNMEGKYTAFGLNMKYTTGTNAHSIGATITMDKVPVKVKNGVTILHRGEHRGKYIMTPYLVVARIMGMLKQLAKRNVLRITTQGHGAEKVRDVTGVARLLKNPAINADYKNIETEIDCLPVEGHMYIPICGVPTMTIAKEKVKLQNIQKIEVIDPNHYQPSEVMRDTSIKREMQDIQIDASIHMLKRLAEAYYQEDPLGNTPEIMQIKDIMRVLGIPFEKMTTEYLSFIMSALAKLHGARTYAEREQIVAGIYGLPKLLKEKADLYDSVGFRSDQIHDMREYDGDPEERKKKILELLNGGVCRLQYISDDLNLSSITCTLNNDAMREAYGSNWYWKCQGKGHKIKYLAEEVMKGQSPEQVMRMVDLSYYINEDNINFIKETLKDASKDNLEDKQREIYMQIFKTNMRTSEDKAKKEYQVAVRTLYAGIRDHIFSNVYLTLGLDKVIKVIELKRF